MVRGFLQNLHEKFELSNLKKCVERIPLLKGEGAPSIDGRPGEG